MDKAIEIVDIEAPMRPILLAPNKSVKTLPRMQQMYCTPVAPLPIQAYFSNVS